MNQIYNIVIDKHIKCRKNFEFGSYSVKKRHIVRDKLDQKAEIENERNVQYKRNKDTRSIRETLKI